MMTDESGFLGRIGAFVRQRVGGANAWARSVALLGVAAVACGEPAAESTPNEQLARVQQAVVDLDAPLAAGEGRAARTARFHWIGGHPMSSPSFDLAGHGNMQIVSAFGSGTGALLSTSSYPSTGYWIAHKNSPNQGEWVSHLLKAKLPPAFGYDGSALWLTHSLFLPTGVTGPGGVVALDPPGLTNGQGFVQPAPEGGALLNPVVSAPGSGVNGTTWKGLTAPADTGVGVRVVDAYLLRIPIMPNRVVQRSFLTEVMVAVPSHPERAGAVVGNAIRPLMVLRRGGQELITGGNGIALQAVDFSAHLNKWVTLQVRADVTTAGGTGAGSSDDIVQVRYRSYLEGQLIHTEEPTVDLSVVHSQTGPISIGPGFALLRGYQGDAPEAYLDELQIYAITAPSVLLPGEILRPVSEWPTTETFGTASDGNGAALVPYGFVAHNGPDRGLRLYAPTGAQAYDSCAIAYKGTASTETISAHRPNMPPGRDCSAHPEWCTLPGGGTFDGTALWLGHSRFKKFTPQSPAIGSQSPSATATPYPDDTSPARAADIQAYVRPSDARLMTIPFEDGATNHRSYLYSMDVFVPRHYENHHHWLRLPPYVRRGNSVDPACCSTFDILRLDLANEWFHLDIRADITTHGGGTGLADDRAEVYLEFRVNGATLPGIALSGGSYAKLDGIAQQASGPLKFGPSFGMLRGWQGDAVEAYFDNISVQEIVPRVVCDDTTTCPSGQTCGVDNGELFGLATGTRVCWDATCDSSAMAECGSVQAKCGLCRTGSVCSEDANCTSDLQCIEGVCGCEPECDGQACGSSDSCGGTCDCGPGETGCDDENDCAANLTCLDGTCTPPECVLNPQLYGCGYAGAPCGPTCTVNPTCTTHADCPSGYICPAGNGWRYGAAGGSVCEKPCCSTDPAACGGCGTLTSECGLCPMCTPDCSDKLCGDADLGDGCGGRCNAVCDDGEVGCERDSDCQAGSLCRTGTCRPIDPCSLPGLAPPHCGGPSTLCGECPRGGAVWGTCLDRECGEDPAHPGVSCGTCATGTCNEGQCLYATDSPPIVVEGPGNTTRPVVPAPAPLAAQIGATPGHFSVSDRGSAMYTIPIEVPPGRAGIEPQLSLRYTSSTANGALGIGWSLDGLSMITRCGRTYAQDEYVEPPRVVPSLEGYRNGAYCLDGQRLVRLPSGEYRTSVDTFSKITVQLTEGGPGEWKVYTKDGRILTYGGWTSAAVRRPTEYYETWALARVEDRSGNYMSIAYQQVSSLETPDTTAEMLPITITYTGQGVTAGNRQVFFQYAATRDDPLVGFRAGGMPMQRTRRLEKIITRVGLQDVKRYNLGYEVVDNTSRLTSVRECGGAFDVECKPPTTFEYYDERPEFAEPFVAYTPNKPGTGSGLDITPVGFVLPNAQGDRMSTIGVHSRYTPTQFVPEAVVLTANFAGPYGWAASSLINLFNVTGTKAFNNVIRYTFDVGAPEVSSGEFLCHQSGMGGTIPTGHVISHPPAGVPNLHGNIYDVCPDYYQFPNGTSQPQSLLLTPRMWFVDVNGDSIQDKLFCSDYFVQPDGSQDGAVLNFKLSNPRADGIPVVPVEADSSTRDGVIIPPFRDICQYDASSCDERNPNGTLVQSCAAGSSYSMSFDIDGDGTGNLLFYDDEEGWTALVLENDVFRFRSDWFEGISFDPVRFNVEAIDINGDGLKDLLALPAEDHAGLGPYAAINTGDGFVQRNLASATPEDGIAPNLQGTPVDLDHDGIEELLEPSEQDDGPWRLRRVVAGVLVSEPVPSLVGGPGLLGDFTGDGNLDVITQSQRLQFDVHAGTGRRHHLLRRVTDGLGRFVDVAYDQENAEGNPVLAKFPPAEHLMGAGMAPCDFPYRCPERVEQALVSSHTESHYVDAGRFGDTLDRIVSYQYYRPWIDTLGYGWLGFEYRSITVLDGAGDFVSSTELTNETPELWDPATSTVPYVHVIAGQVKRVDERTATVASSLVPYSPGKRVEIHWAKKASEAGLQFPFAELQITHFTNGVTPLFKRWEQRSVDGYGNVHSELIHDTDTSGFTIDDAVNDVDGSTETTQISRTFAPTPAESQAWLISLMKEEIVSTAPRCPIGDQLSDCVARNRTRRSLFYYRPNTGLLYLAHREPGNQEFEQVTDIDHDDYGNPDWIQVRSQLGTARTRRVAYDSDGIYPLTVTQIGEGAEHPTTVRYDARFGTLVARADPNGIDETWTRDALGVLRHHRGPSGEMTRDYGNSNLDFVDGYAVFGNYKVTTRTGISASPGAPLTGGSEVEEHFNALGQLVRRIGRGYNGTYVAEELAYDARNRLVAHQRPHMPFGPNLFSTTYEYDELDRVIAQHNPDGGDIEYEYGATDGYDLFAVLNLPEDWRLPDVRLIRRVVGPQRNTTDPQRDDTVELMNRDGAPVAVVDALGKFTRYQYGAFGTLRGIETPAGRDITFDHDAYGRARSVNDPSRGPETTFYNGLDEIVRTVDALNRERNFFYDDFGRLEEVQDADGSTLYTYDGSGPNEIGRLVETTSPTGQRTRYGYEPPTATRNRGALTAVTEYALPVGTTSPVARALTTQYHYDEVGRLEEIEYPEVENGGVSVRNHFDAYGHVIKVTDAQNAADVFWELLTPNEGYRIGTERVGNAVCGATLGTTTTRVYKPGTDALAGITTTCGASTLQNLSYGYDEAGNLTSRLDTVADVGRTYLYDALNRPTHVNGIETFTYDADRGRLTSQAGIGAYAYASESTSTAPRDWLETMGGAAGTSYEHDAVGNVTRRSGMGVPGGQQVFTYNAFDLPKRIDTGAAGSAFATEFAYTASGTRVTKQTGGSSPRSTFYAGDAYQRTEPAIAPTPQAAQHRSVIYAGGRAVAQLTSGEDAQGELTTPVVRYLYDDVLGSVQTMADTNGATLGTRDYEPFGKHGGSLSSDVMLGFTGHEEDTELGVVNMKGRTYDPLAGQFLQTDPIIAEPYSQGLNRYAYVNNSPLNYVDPSGLMLDERDQFGVGMSAFGVGVVGGTACAAFCGNGMAAAGVVEGAAAASALGGATAAANVSLSVWNVVNPTMSRSVTGTAPQQSRSSPASGRGVPGRGRAAPNDVAPVREGPPQNKGGVGPRTGLSQDAGTPETSGTMGRGGGSSAMPKADLSREAEFLALTLIPAARAAQLIATGIRLARAAQIARALSISAKAARGAKAEAYVAKLFEGAGVELVGKQVSVRTAAGLRRIDLLVRDKAGQLFAIEVKSGTATRNAVQLAKDRLLASEGGRLVGANAGRLSGEHHVINTIEFLVP